MITAANLDRARRYIVSARYRVIGRQISKALRRRIHGAIARYLSLVAIVRAGMLRSVPYRCPYGCLEACMRPARCPCAGSRLAGAA